jgi:uncharacterized protein (DUF1800 family)
VTRAVVSEAQLEEALAAFWFNHFNVFSQKGAVRWMVPPTSARRSPARARQVSGPGAGHARQPAMLFYLDNWMSTRADLVMPRGQNAGRASGLNENYARELMELTRSAWTAATPSRTSPEVARCFTGWTIDRPREGGRICSGLAHTTRQQARARPDDSRRRRREGRRARHRHPGAASVHGALHLTKLARHFVSDEPPAALVSRMAATFRSTDGDIRA